MAALGLLISEAERSYIIGGCRDGIRYDGRDVHDFRLVSFENNIFPHVNGSSRVKIGDVVDVICAVKLEVGESNPHAPKEGIVSVNVDISPSCALRVDDNRLTDYSDRIGDLLQRTYLSCNALDMKQLSIIPGKVCWVVHVDITVLQADGDPLDACSFASYIALQCCKIPRIELFAGESGQLDDFDVSSDLSDSLLLNTARVPIIISVFQLGSSYILDAVASEQLCSSCSLSVAVDESGNCCGAVKFLEGSFAAQDTLQCIHKCSQAAASIFSQFRLYFSDQCAKKLDEGFRGLYPDLIPSRHGLLA